MRVVELLTQGQIGRQMGIAIDTTNAFLVDPDKEKFYSERPGIKRDRDSMSHYMLPDKLFPPKVVDDFEISAYIGEQEQPIASALVADMEIPSSNGTGNISHFEGELCKVGLSYHFTEKRQIELFKFGRAGNIPPAFINMMFGNVTSVSHGINKLGLLWTWQVIYQGRVDWSDPRSSVRYRINYKVDPNLVSTAIPSAEASWDNAATADGIGDLEERSDRFYDVNGFYPDYTLMSRRAVRYLLAQESTRDRALDLAILNNASTSGRTNVGSKVLALIFESLNIPPLKIFDARCKVEFGANQIVSTRYLPEEFYAFGTEGMGTRFFGATLENNGKGGIYLKAEELLKTSPPQQRASGVARIIPFTPDPKLIASQRILR